MRGFNDLAIGTRIHGITLLAIIGLALLGGLALQKQREVMYERVERKTEHVVDTAYSLVEYYANAAAQGRYTTTEAQRMALDALKNLRYGGTEYFWINDMHPTMVMHPTKPELDGKDLSDFKDPQGVPVFVRMVETVKAGGGKGAVHYMWPKPGATEPQPKISFVKAYAPWGWVIGSGVYVDDIETAIAEQVKAFLTIAALIILPIMVLAVIIARSITRPICAATGVMSALSQGNLNVDVPGVGRRDEVGQMATSIAVFRDQSRKLKEAELRQLELEKEARAQRVRAMHEMADHFESSVSGVIQSITHSVEQMQHNAETLNHIASNTKEKVTIVAAAAHETSVTASTVASASEELSAAIREISSQVQKSSGITQDASRTTGTVTKTMGTLLEQTDNISQVSDFINKVAEQINLLALNATIESARAGEAGKGFAVVAGEVKQLASQTTQASSQISQQISTIQSSSTTAESSIQEVNNIIQLIAQSVTSIAAAIEEQAAATREIARNITESSAAAEDVTRNIFDVEQSAKQTDETASAVLTGARDLNQQATLLKESVAKFLATIRSNQG